MIGFVEAIFWGSFVVLLYTYFGYPALVFLFARTVKEESHRGNVYSRVSIIVSVYNESRYIRKKIENSLGSIGVDDQLIVISDGSDDGTEKIAATIDDPRLLILNNAERRGKSYSLQKVMPYVKGEISVFTDANVFFGEKAVERLLEPFVDSRCGAVCGNVDLVALDSGEPLGEGLYMRYERFIQSAESSVRSVVGTEGGMLAVRTELVPQLPAGLVLDDLYMVLKVIEAGYRVRYEPRAWATEPVPARVAQEFRRKVRIAAGGFEILRGLPLVRYALRRPATFWMFVSHKVLRWTSGVFVVSALVSNIVLLNSSILYGTLLTCQLLLWAMGTAAWIATPLRVNRLFYPIYYFGAMNLASLAGLFQSLWGRQNGVWQRVDR